ncbi:hypothetical protein M8C21_000834 [Ambrosia artemisiifolia]|uniref:Uncharacterized protein n=1 Tax=Ambrosia artemisiifolia TaxID=4212 RepID=A0AAD5CH32_AMBAR|nr:hypothetical protein M8C21_000834 [Ambrosia artemisiifolia]
MKSFMSFAKNPLLSPIKHFIHPDFHKFYEKMRPIDRPLFLIVHGVDKSRIGWHRFPVFLGLTYLGIRRNLHDKYNLLNVGNTPVGDRYDNLKEGASSEGTFFGRNMVPVDKKDKVSIGISTI